MITNENTVIEPDLEIDDSDTYYEHHRVVCDPKQSPIRIDKYLTDRIAGATRSKLQGAIELGLVRVNERHISANYKVRPNDVISVIMTKPASAHVLEPEQMDLDIRYEDDDLLIVYKPPGLVVHPGVGQHRGTLVNGLAYHFDHKAMVMTSDTFNARAGLVHRIDKDTSGLLVVGKNEKALAHLAKQFYDHTVTRTYNAIIWGEPEANEGRIEAMVGRHPRFRMTMAVTDDSEEGKHAVTHWRMLERIGYVSLVECKLETGRTHQIRVHMKHIGHTLFGDVKYGGNRILKGTIYSKYKQFVENCLEILPRQALHAKTLGFTHPTTGERMFFDSDIPDDMVQVLNKWRTYVGSRKVDLEAMRGLLPEE
jgi:23S rRNA pseudouridine1911/1915/1917 synthase